MSIFAARLSLLSPKVELEDPEDSLPSWIPSLRYVQQYYSPSLSLGRGMCGVLSSFGPCMRTPLIDETGLTTVPQPCRLLQKQSSPLHSPSVCGHIKFFPHQGCNGVHNHQTRPLAGNDRIQSIQTLHEALTRHLLVDMHFLCQLQQVAVLGVLRFRNARRRKRGGRRGDKGGREATPRHFNESEESHIMI